MTSQVFLSKPSDVVAVPEEGSGVVMQRDSQQQWLVFLFHVFKKYIYIYIYVWNVMDV